MDIRTLALYFVIGGTVVSAITYFGSQGKSMLAALIALFPSITLITLCTIYLTSDIGTSISYAKGLLMLVPSMVLYIIMVILLLPRIGLVGSLVVGITVYLGTSLVIMKLKEFIM